MQLIPRNAKSTLLSVRSSLRQSHAIDAAETPRASAYGRPALVSLFSMVLLSVTAVVAHAQAYTSIVIFGDSLSDTGNVAHLTQHKYGERIPGPVADYTDGRFTDGMDTVPAARNYFGVWVEQLAAMLPDRPVIKDSLDGGTNYAYGFATTGAGSAAFTFGPSNALSVNINNIGQQITDYLATKPRITNKTLFIVWGGAINVLHATSSQDVVDSAIEQTLNIDRLIQAGATQFIVPNLPPLGAIPRLNGSPLTSLPATEATVVFNSVLDAGLGILRDLHPGKRLGLYQLDVFHLFNQVIASPSRYDLADVTSMSQGDYTINPDTFLFWDDLHPTTRGHNILARKALKLIRPDDCDVKDRSGERCEAVLAGENEGPER